MTDEMLSGDGWTPSTGLADDFDGTITDAYFTRDAKFPPDACILKLVILSDDPDIGEISQLFSCGSGFEIVDNGAHAVHGSKETTGKNKPFNNNTNAWAFIQSAAKVGAAKVMQDRGTMWDADVWKGLRFHFKRVDYKPFNWQEGDKIPQRMVATAYLGTGEATTETRRDAGVAESNGNGVSPLIRAKLVKLASESKDHDDFMSKAFDLEGVAGDSSVEALVMSTSKGSIWASREQS